MKLRNLADYLRFDMNKAERTRFYKKKHRRTRKWLLDGRVKRKYFISDYFPMPEVVKAQKQKQKELDPYEVAGEKRGDDELPPRGTGRRTGTAKEPTGPEGRLTEEERRKRHKEQTAGS